MVDDRVDALRACYETVGNLTDAQLVAEGRKFFDRVDRVPPPRSAARS